MVTSQLPVVNWHQALGDPTMADAILDRVVHNAYKMELLGEDSMRKLLADIDADKTCETLTNTQRRTLRGVADFIRIPGRLASDQAADFVRIRTLSGKIGAESD